MNKKTHLILMLGLTLGLTFSKPELIKAQSNNIPPVITEIVTNIDLANNNQDLELLKKHISPNFTNQDGLNLDLLTQSLNKQWSKYKDLKYTTTIESWEEKGNNLSFITKTTVTGSYEANGKTFTLNSNIRARQQLNNNQIFKQEILSEKTEITAGENPPTITVNLPERVRPGQEFDFDVVLQEPIGSDIVLGGVAQEKISPNLYLEPSNIELDALTAGGIFKRVKLPISDQNHWYSAIFIRNGGIRIINQRVNVEG